jgi:hypothetical protein
LGEDTTTPGCPTTVGAGVSSARVAALRGGRKRLDTTEVEWCKGLVQALGYKPLASAKERPLDRSGGDVGRACERRGQHTAPTSSRSARASCCCYTRSPSFRRTTATKGAHSIGAAPCEADRTEMKPLSLNCILGHPCIRS